MSDPVLKEISEKLDKLIKLQAMTAVKDQPSERDKIALLHSLDFRNIEIARMLGKDPHNVDVVISDFKKAPKTRKKSSTLSEPKTIIADSVPTIEKSAETSAKQEAERE